MKSTVEKDIVFLMVALALNTPQVCNSLTVSLRLKSTKMNIVSYSMTKDSDRARTERNLDDMMGDDWRVFRAKLITQEKEQAERVEEVPSCDFGDENCSEEEKKHNRLGNLFASAISSIFSPHDKSSSSTSTMIADQEDISIFNGNNVGRVGPLEDPFASERGIVAVSPHDHQVQFDKHRWAHPISHVEPGCILIANEKLGGVFHQTVFLVIDHNEATGSTGVCINRPLPGNLLKVASETNDSNLDLSLKLSFNTATVSYGGPVMQSDYSILHGFAEVEGAKKVSPGIFIGGSRELMSEVRKNHFSPSDALFIKGHAAWIPSQLTREVSKGVWYTASVSPDFILRYAGAPICKEDNAKDLWSDILTCMAGQYANIAKKYAGRGDKRMSYKK